MTTLQLQLDDDLNSFVVRQSRARGYASAAAYVESLLSFERLRERSEHVTEMLKEATGDAATVITVDDEYWSRLETEVLGRAALGE